MAETFSALLRRLMDERNLTESAAITALWGDLTGKPAYVIASRRDRLRGWLAGTQRPCPRSVDVIARTFAVTVKAVNAAIEASWPTPPLGEPLLAMTQVPSEAAAARLQVDCVVPAAIAAKVVAMLTDPDVRAFMHRHVTA